MKVPYSFNDITLSQFMQWHKIKNDSTLELLDKNTHKLSILTGKSIDEIEPISNDKRVELLSKVTYMDYVPKDLKVCKRFRAGGFMLVPTMSLQEMKVNQFVDFQTILKHNELNYIACANELLAIMFKPINFIGSTIYRPSKHAKISELLLSAKAGDCLGLLFFYLRLWQKCSPTILQSLENGNKTISETMQEILNDKEFLDFLANGDGNITLTNVQQVTV